MGRSDSDPPATAFLLRMTSAERAALDELAARTGKSRAWLIRRALREYAEHATTGRKR